MYKTPNAMERRGKKTAERPKYTCRDCANSYGWCSKALDGSLILCRCRHYTDGKWCKFLKDPQCEHFARRKETGNG